MEGVTRNSTYSVKLQTGESCINKADCSLPRIRFYQQSKNIVHSQNVWERYSARRETPKVLSSKCSVGTDRRAHYFPTVSWKHFKVTTNYFSPSFIKDNRELYCPKNILRLTCRLQFNYVGTIPFFALGNEWRKFKQSA